MVRRSTRRLAPMLGLAVAIVVGGLSALVVHVSAQPSASERAPAAAPRLPYSQEGMYAYYYLWWSTQHWYDSLGPNYPYNQSPLPLPASLDATGCNPTSLYSGNIETDVPATLFTQDDPLQVLTDVHDAIAAGLSGFAVD